MSADIIRLNSELRLNGVGRDADHDKALVLYFNRRLTDDEMRFIHDCAARAANFAGVQ